MLHCKIVNPSARVAVRKNSPSRGQPEVARLGELPAVNAHLYEIGHLQFGVGPIGYAHAGFDMQQGFDFVFGQVAVGTQEKVGFGHGRDARPAPPYLPCDKFVTALAKVEESFGSIFRLPVLLAPKFKLRLGFALKCPSPDPDQRFASGSFFGVSDWAGPRGYRTLAETVMKKLLSVVPSEVTDVMINNAISDAIMAYSIAVAPPLLAVKRLNNNLIAGSPSLYDVQKPQDKGPGV